MHLTQAQVEVKYYRDHYPYETTLDLWADINKFSTEFGDIENIPKFLSLLKGRFVQYMETGLSFRSIDSRYVDTRYHFNDALQAAIKYGKLVQHPAYSYLLHSTDQAWKELIPEIKDSLAHQRFDIRYYTLHMFWKVGTWCLPFYDEIVEIIAEDLSLRPLAKLIPREVVKRKNSVQALYETYYMEEYAKAKR